MSTSTDTSVRVASLAEVQDKGCFPVQVAGHTLVLFAQGEQIYALDNRCPHMGFPLERGTVRDGILTCHWHHARFDLASGGTFDQWAGDARSFPVTVRDGEVWVDTAAEVDPHTYQRQRLQTGLERNVSLVIGKSVIAQLDAGDDAVEPFRTGLAFGVRYRRQGWGQGLTILTCMMNLLRYLDREDHPRALYLGLSALANDCDGAPPRFPVKPLPGGIPAPGTLKRWFRQFVEVRDAEGAERCIVSAVRTGADDRQMADMLFAAATDHRYIQIGHVLDFTNKALEALDIAGWDQAEAVLASLVPAYAGASRMEESNAWRYPVDLIDILNRAFEALPAAYEQGQRHAALAGDDGERWEDRRTMEAVLLGDDPQAIADALLAALREGYPPAELGMAVTYAAAQRIARFHTSNEFSDWDTALHTFTFANAVQQGLRRVPSVGLLRGVFDAAMSVFLDRFLNVPAARLPQPAGEGLSPDAVLEKLPALLDRQQQVNEAGEMVAHYLYGGGAPDRLLARLGGLLLREDRNFHTIQTLEAAYRQLRTQGGLSQLTPASANILIGAARYMAAHAPTARAQGQTYQIARRLHRGERLFEEE